MSLHFAMKKKEKTREQEKPAPKRHCPKCNSPNTVSVGEDKDQTFYCLDCDYAEGIGVE